MRAWLLCLALTTSAAVRAEHFVSATFFQHHELRSISAGSAVGPSVGWTWFFDEHFGVGAGVRFDVPLLNMRPSLEGYVRGVITVPVKSWSPALALEFGVIAGGGKILQIRPSRQLYDEVNSEGPVYFAMHTELLRFVFGRILVSFMGVQVGTAIPPGSTLRVQFDFLTVGWKL